ncbi:hypothetical protein HMPREF0372_01316 [Flavonifractor plautii ATCC 29863]|uniref:Uncharacterized protein n=1 Tax=Flavonifractor plautii ATCC 29863 TaxID=411475 RepID=G9YP87_FLAPL|nr:hypothetical protein HMPREF0372_01316 [Flavonifractor plautii ATCC 29863]
MCGFRHCTTPAPPVQKNFVLDFCLQTAYTTLNKGRENDRPP